MAFREEDVPAVLDYVRRLKVRKRVAHREIWELLQEALTEGFPSLTTDGIFCLSQRDAVRELRRLEREIVLCHGVVVTTERAPESARRAAILNALWFQKTN